DEIWSDAAFEPRSLIGAMPRGPGDLAHLVLEVEVGPGPGVNVFGDRLVTVHPELDPVMAASQVQVVGPAVEIVGRPDVAAVQIDARLLGRNVRIDDGPLRRRTVDVAGAVCGTVVAGPTPTPAPAPTSADEDADPPAPPT